MDRFESISKQEKFLLGKISTDRKFSENIIVKNWKIFNFKIFYRRKICVGQTHFTKFSFCAKFFLREMGLNLAKPPSPQVVPDLQTSCYKVVVRPISGCVRTACSQLL
jgi:hypothetical protein